jgi:hypothetical protein
MPRQAKANPTAAQQDATPDRARPIWEKAFLLNLRKTGNISLACRSAKIERSTAYRHRDDDKEFQALWESALEDAADALEEEARRRAVTGVLEPIYQRGEKVGVIRKYSDSLLALLLKANKPEKFRERADITSDGKPIPIAIVKMDLDEL